jgi:HD-like signal output (HDOD) protein
MPNTTNTTDMIHDAIELADHAARQSDRWLFIAALLIMIGGAFLAMRFLVSQNNRLIDDHAKARDSYQSALTSIVEKQNATCQHLGEVVTRNSLALDECASEIRLCREQRDRRAV